MKKILFLLIIASVFLVGCQPIEEWKTIGEQTDSQSTSGNQLSETVSLAFQKTSFTFQSVILKEKQLIVSIDWENEDDKALSFSECYASFSAYIDDEQLVLTAPGTSEKIAPGESQQLNFTFENVQHDQSIRLLFEVEPTSEQAKHFDIFLG